MNSNDGAENIRAQRRADAAPPPEEARREARDSLAREGCHVEGCDEDGPDNLTREWPVTHNCPARQAPPPRCGEHAIA